MGWFDSVLQVANPIQYVTTNAATGGEVKRQANNIDGTGNPTQTTLMGSNAAAREADLAAGEKKGKEIFYDDPDMKALREKREDLAKGYSGEELGALKGQAEDELQGNSSNYLRQLSSRSAKAGVGGARGAAMVGAADQGFNKNAAEMNRKMTLDNANLVRSGQTDLQNFIFNQKYGSLGTSLGYGQMGVADRAADAQAALANKKEDKGLIGGLMSNIGF